MIDPRPLVDNWGRIHDRLRLSVTDRCNLRCRYCVGGRPVVFQPREALLSFEEIIRLVQVGATLGIGYLRLTGGEPLLRKGLPHLVSRLRTVDGIREIALTTNGTLLAAQARQLREAGVNRVNISLDCLSPQKFAHLTGGNIGDVLEGIDAALEARFEEVKLNALAIRDFTEEEIVPLTEFARSRGMQIRFIELMRLADNGVSDNWEPLPAATIVQILERYYGKLIPRGADPSHTHVVSYRFPDGKGEVGVIGAMTTPFCHRCGRLRLTADGKLRNCLFATDEFDLRELLRRGATDKEIGEVFLAATKSKWYCRPQPDAGQATLPVPMHRVGG